MAERWTETLVANCVDKLFPSPAYACLRQLRNGTGYSRKVNRTADMFVVSCYPSRGLYFVGVEIKISTSDWRKEVALPDKAAELQKYCRHWYVAAPKGVVNVGEVPATWGYIECDRVAAIVKPAPILEPMPPDMLLVCSLLRNAAEHYSKGYVTVADITQRVESQISERVDAKILPIEYELTETRKAIAQFQEASGVEIAPFWKAGIIGEAVKTVLRQRHIDGFKQATILADAFERHAKELRATIKELSVTADVDSEVTDG